MSHEIKTRLWKIKTGLWASWAIVQYRLKSYAHWHAWTARAECVYCAREERDETARFTNETRAVHERKPRFKIYLSQMDEMATQKDRVGYCVFIVFLWMDFFSHWQLANSEILSQPVPLGLSSIAAFIDEVKLACEYSGRLSSLSANFAFRETPNQFNWYVITNIV